MCENFIIHMHIKWNCILAAGKVQKIRTPGKWNSGAVERELWQGAKCLTLPPVAYAIRVHGRTLPQRGSCCFSSCLCCCGSSSSTATLTSFSFHHCHNFVSQFCAPRQVPCVHGAQWDVWKIQQRNSLHFLPLGYMSYIYFFCRDVPLI